MIEARLFVPNFSEIDTSEQIIVMGEAVGPRKVYYRLGESELFTYVNQNTNIRGEKLINVIPKMVVSDQGFLHVDYSQLDKTVQYELFEGPRYKLTCRKSIRELIDNGRLQMVYSEDYKLPTCIPYILQGTGPSCRAYINVSDFLTLDQYGKYQISLPRNYNALMAILFAAAVAVRIMETTATIPADLADGMVLVHSAMLTRAINALVHMDGVMKDKIAYITSMFALIQMYGTETGSKLFYSRFATKYFPRLTKMITDTIDAQIQLDSYDTLTRLCAELSRNYPSLTKIDSYRVMDKWIRLYGSATSMSIDYIGYHIYTICMVLFESPLISRMALEPVMEKNKGLDMYRRMQAIIGNQ